MSSLLSCQGSNCNICSLLETISNAYNFLLGISFAVAALFAVIIGFLYLTNSLGKKNFKKSFYALRNALLGLALILTGWLIINVSVWFAGFKNAGSWWQFHCEVADSEQPAENLAKYSSFQPKSPYANLKTFTSLADFIKSSEQRGRLTGLSSVTVFLNQIQTLPPDKSLTFLAPARLTSQNATADQYLPVLTVKKEADKIRLASTGEYWDVIQNGLLAAGTNNGTPADPIDGMGQITGYFDKVPTVTGWSAINEKGESLSVKKQFDLLSFLLPALYLESGTASLAQAGDSSEPIANSNAGNTSLAELITIMANGTETINGSATFANIIGWIIIEFIKTFVGLAVEKTDSPSAAGPLSNPTAAANPVPLLPKNSENLPDEDKDGIPDEKDACPITPPEYIADINTDREAKAIYGCSCAEIGLLQDCPLDACQGQYWVTYSHSPQPCLNGRFLSYVCRPQTIEIKSDCPQRSQKNTTETTDSHDNRNIPWGEGDNALGGPPLADSPESVKAALRFIYQYDPLRYAMIFRYIDRIVDVREINRLSQGIDGFIMNGSGMVFVNFTLPREQLADTLVHETTHSAQVYLYEKDNGPPALKEMERVAIANEMGSLSRVTDLPDMSEFPGQGKGVAYQNKEVRGYASRMMKKANPLAGYLGTAAYYAPVRYASEFGDLVQGPYHYGDDEAGLVVGLTEGEEGIIKNIIENQEKCLSKPPADLPQIPSCNDAYGILKIGGYDWYPN